MSKVLDLRGKRKLLQVAFCCQGGLKNFPRRNLVGALAIFHFKTQVGHSGVGGIVLYPLGHP